MGFFDDITGGGIVKGLMSFGAGAYQTAQNKAMMREQMRYNTSEREASQAFQTGEREAQQAFQTGERNAQNQYSEDMYNKYQSPEALAKQYMQAGLDPRMAMGNGQVGSISASSGSSGGAPSSGAPSGSHINPPYQDVQSLTAGFSNITQAVKAMQEAKKAGYESDVMRNSVDALVRITNADATIKELEARFGLDTYNPRVKKAFADYAYSDKKNKELDILLDILEDEKVIKHNERKHWYDIFFRGETSWAADVGESLSRTSLNESIAKLNEISAQFEGKYKKSIINLNNSIARINKVDAEIKEATSEDEIKAINYRNKGAFEEFDTHLAALHAEAVNLIKEGKYKEWKLLINTIEAAADAVGSVKGTKFAPLHSRSSSNSNVNSNSHSVNHSYIYHD